MEDPISGSATVEPDDGDDGDDGDSIPGGQKSISGELRSSGGTQEPNHEDP
jgi:hypothetical protein